MDNKAFLSSLTSGQRAALTQRSNTKGLIHLMGHVGLIALCSVMILSEILYWQAIMAVQGVLLIFLFTLLHETSHKTPFRTIWINDVVGHICGFILFIPAKWFKYFHMAHHRFTQIPGLDPEIDTPKPGNWVQYLVHMSGIPIWVGQAKTISNNVFRQNNESLVALVPLAQNAKVRLESKIYLTMYLCLFAASIGLGTATLLYLWLLPIILGQPFLRLYLLAEHSRCPKVTNMLENTRTTRTNRLVRAIAWNMPYHTEHHTFPSVPFHRLPALHALLKPHLQVTSKGYLAFNKVYIQEEL